MQKGRMGGMGGMDGMGGMGGMGGMMQAMQMMKEMKEEMQTMRAQMSAMGGSATPGCRVFVRGFDFGTTRDQVLKHMSSVGTVENVAMVGKGEASVTYGSIEDASAAVMQLHRST